MGQGIARLIQPWRQGWRQWWLRRHPTNPELTLGQRNLYVLPTRAGITLGVILLLLLIGSINFQLNLGFLLTFLLGASAVVGMHVAHRNLRGLRLTLQSDTETFAHQPSAVQVTLHNPLKRHRWGISIRRLEAEPASAVWSDVGPDDTSTVAVSPVFTHRGWQPLEPLLIETWYPLGSVRVWAWWRPSQSVLVYPAPEPHPPELPSAWSPQGEQGLQAPVQNPSADWDDWRPYRQGDSLRRVIWKQAARTAQDSRDDWVVRTPSTASGDRLWLDANRCGLNDPEAQRSRLCAWVLQADSLGLLYGLRLGAIAIEPGAGPEHRRRCLEALACH